MMMIFTVFLILLVWCFLHFIIIILTSRWYFGVCHLVVVRWKFTPNELGCVHCVIIYMDIMVFSPILPVCRFVFDVRRLISSLSCNRKSGKCRLYFTSSPYILVCWLSWWISDDAVQSSFHFFIPQLDQKYFYIALALDTEKNGSKKFLRYFHCVERASCACLFCLPLMQQIFICFYET